MEEIKQLLAITQKLKDKYIDLNNSVWKGSWLVTSEVLGAEKMSEL